MLTSNAAVHYPRAGRGGAALCPVLVTEHVSDTVGDLGTLQYRIRSSVLLHRTSSCSCGLRVHVQVQPELVPGVFAAALHARLLHASLWLALPRLCGVLRRGLVSTSKTHVFCACFGLSAARRLWGWFWRGRAAMVLGMRED